MEGEDVMYSRKIQVKTGNGQYKNKKIIILLTMKGYKIKLQDEEDVFYCKTVSISQLDYGTNFKNEQKIMAGFNEFPGLIIEILNKTMDPQSGFYLELSENQIATKLEFCEKTQLRRITHLELMLSNEHLEEIRRSVLCTIHNNKVELQLSEITRHSLMDTIHHYEKIEELLKKENNYLLENQLHCRAQAIKLVLKTQQKIEELEKMYLQTFHNYQKEKDEELRSLKITNNSLDALYRVLEAENAMIKENMRKESEKLKSTIESKEQVDKDLKILKAKITKCTKELKEVHEQVLYFKKETCRLKKTEEQIEKMEEDCHIAKKAFDNCSRKLRECESVLRDQALRIQAMAKTIENLKKEDAQTKAANALMNKKLKMNADLLVDFRNKLQNKHSELQNRNKIILELENDNKILRQRVLDLQYEIELLLRRPIPSTNSDTSKDQEGLSTYLKDKYQAADLNLSTKNTKGAFERTKVAKLTEDKEKTTLSDIICPATD